VLRADGERVRAFRLHSQNLACRLPAAALSEAAAVCGIQNSPPGSAALALHARVSGLTPAGVANALERDRTLLQVWSVRASPYVVPTGDVAVFTRGLLPEDEASLRVFVAGMVPVLDEVGMTATDVVERTAAALHEALDGRVLTKRQMGAALAERLPERLGPWFEPSTFSEYTATFARPVALRGWFCFAPRAGNEAAFVRTDQWLERSLPDVDPDAVRAELVRRYLRGYGPSNPADYALWAGIGPEQAGRAWRLVEHELVEVEVDGIAAWLAHRDLPAFCDPVPATGVRFLPPHDPYLLLRDRATLLPDRAVQRRVWRATHNPGVVLADGRVAALWRQRKRGRRLHVAVEPLAPLPVDAVEREAAVLGAYRGCDDVIVEEA
jgi:hypothetical protein